MSIRTVRTVGAGLVLACTVSAGAAPRVAIVASSTNTANAQAEPRFTDPRDKIRDTDLFESVDIINTTDIGDGTGVPDLATLLQYDAVITWSNVNYADAVAMGDVLADYVEAGGGVVVAMYANTSTNTSRFLQGRWQEPARGLIAIPQGGGFTTSTTAELGMVFEPSHPIMTGVTNFINDVGIGTNGPFGAWRPTSTAINPGSTLIARYDDGKTLIVVAPNQGVVELGFHPVSSAVNDGYWNETSDGDLIMANALFFVAGGFDCDADFDGDGDADGIDIGLFLQAYGTGNLAADLDGNGMLNGIDVGLFLQSYSTGC